MLADGNWLDVSQAAVKAGSRADSVLVHLAAVGDGSRVYLSDGWPNESHGRSYLGEIKNGAAVLASAPHVNKGEWLPECPRDATGGLWIPGGILRTPDSDFAITQLAIRLTEKGEAESLKNAGRAVLCDEGGNVWLGNIKGGNVQDFNLWREGKIAATVAVPSARGWNDTCLASDRPGSVWAWTVTGLYHLTADNPAQPATFAVKGCWQVRGLVGEFKSMEASSLGFLVIRTAHSEPSRGWQYYLHLVPLPKD